MEFIMPNWPAPSHIHACSTTRIGGISPTPFDSLNMAHHVGDHARCYQENRQRIKSALNLPSEPLWLNQTHSATVIDISAGSNTLNQPADGAYFKRTDQQSSPVLAIMTADCLPILMCDRQGHEIAALHGGWRSLHRGIIQAGLALFNSSPEELLVWFGPAISAKHYEVGPEIEESFVKQNVVFSQAFKPHGKKFMLDIYQLARMIFNSYGVTHCYGQPHCTYANPTQFFSYRRDGITGRMATLIWIKE